MRGTVLRAASVGRLFAQKHRNNSKTSQKRRFFARPLLEDFHNDLLHYGAIA